MSLSARHTVLCLLAIASCIFKVDAQNPEAYRIYNSKGKQVDFGMVADKLAKNDVVFFGELHNNPICHWLQFELTQALQGRVDTLVLGAEMLECDDQLVVDEYLQGFIPLKHLEKEAKLWPNFRTDYLPLLDLAKEDTLRFIATNVPRRYASLVSKKGMSSLDSLSEGAKAILPPLPYTVTIQDAGYIEMRAMMGFHGGGVGVDDMIAAQALKDYTMAWNIFRHLPEEGLFLHFNGSFHSQKFAGIYNYLKARNKRLKIAVIATVESEDLGFKEEWKELGDYILVTPESMTKTH